MPADAAARTAAALADGGVALVPTDTVYGLVARPDRAKAIQRIFELKNRPETLNLQILLPIDLPLTAVGATAPPQARALLARDDLRAGVTCILPLAEAARPGWLAHREEAGVRIPADGRTQSLLALTGPLFATSANAHGAPPGRRPADILAQLAGAPDAVWDVGPLGGEASTVVNFNADPPTVLRWGIVRDLTEFGLGHG